MAHLFIDQEHKKQDTTAHKQLLLQELNRVIKLYYQDEPAFESWSGLEAIATDYLAARQLPAPETTPNPKPKIDWLTAPDVTRFYGRTVELQYVTDAVVTEGCRLIGLFGLGGIGKSALAARWGLNCRDQFAYVIWHSLTNPPALKDLLGDCILFLSHHQHLHLPPTVEGRISILLDYFYRYRCLLILDNVESILRGGSAAGRYRPGYQDYSELLQQVAESDHHSCLLLTGREKPYEFTLLEGEALPVRSFHISGLSLNEGQRILQEKGLFGGLRPRPS